MDEVKEYKSLNIEKSASYISSGGPLSIMYENFEERKSQIDLLKSISYAFNENKLGVFEAGTGVGKSYAYLIPSALWALQNNEKIIISTGTINLQSQLCDKDIPAVENILGKKIKYILMKGRQNYICKRRLQDAALMPDLFEEDNEKILKIAEWAKKSSTGSKSDMDYMPSESVWTRVNSESDACMGNKCPFFSDCFVMKVRKEAADANLIVVNHHLFFADIEARMNGGGYENTIVLPPYNRIVFDEAHGIESAATSFFSESINRFKVNKVINQLYRKRKNSESGHLLNVAIMSSNEDKVLDAFEVTSQIRNDLVKLETAAQDLIQNDYSVRLYEVTERNFGPLLSCMADLKRSLGKFSDIVNKVLEGVADEDKDTPSFWETRSLSRNLEQFVSLINSFTVWNEHPGNVFWIQKKRLPADMAKDGNPFYTVFTSTPLDISRLMNEGVFEPMKSVVFTSATLRTGNSYSYWMNRTGLAFADQERIIAKDFESPFPYHSNMLFAVPNDAPFQENIQFQQFVEMALTKLILAAGGRTLVLFTSYDSLKSAFNTVSLQLKGFTGKILKQGDDDNARILETFKNETESVLFATDSFWQGVDVPGESLSQVVIVKLPFSVPKDPVFMARSESIERRGGNAFMELSVPEAVIKFRQGVGRLIRTGSDRGVVIVLDRRIYEKRYGSIFNASVPECKRTYDTFSETVSNVKRFIDL
ncbi:MAG: ATP-dependent DNA helicase [Treponema sp.]|nr:ATP-dependent DNA helicase [Treponema sp.]